jgi:hypothetical protein
MVAGADQNIGGCFGTNPRRRREQPSDPGVLRAGLRSRPQIWTERRRGGANHGQRRSARRRGHWITPARHVRRTVARPRFRARHALVGDARNASSVIVSRCEPLRAERMIASPRAHAREPLAR